MENIKSQLIKNLDDINQVFDHHNQCDQVLSLNSRYIDDITDSIYELIVELVADTKEIYEAGNYHSDMRYIEGAGYLSEIAGIRIQSVYIFKDNGDADINISYQDIEDSIKF